MKTIDKIKKRAGQKMLQRIVEYKVAIIAAQKDNWRRNMKELKALQNMPVLMEKEVIENYPVHHSGIGYTKAIMLAALLQDVVIFVPSQEYIKDYREKLIELAEEYAKPETAWEYIKVWVEEELEQIKFKIWYWKLNYRYKRLTKN